MNIPYFPSGYIVLLVVMAYGQLFLLARCIRLRIHVGIKWLGLIQFLDEYLSGRNFHLLFHNLFVTYDKKTFLLVLLNH